jgi:tetratricopeptide (TPR) repeat protein
VGLGYGGTASRKGPVTDAVFEVRERKISAMIGQQSLDRLINGPSAAALAGAAGVGAVLVLMAFGVLLFSAGRRKWIAGILGVLGLSATFAVIYLVHTQTVKTRESESVTVTRPRFPESVRSLARGATIGLPSLCVVVSLVAWGAARRRLRSRLPRVLKAGRAHFFQKEYEAALGQYHQALHIAPYLGEAYCGRGCVYQAMGDSARALADFERAIECDPRQITAYIQRARIRTDQDDFEGALADFETLLNMRATDPDLYLHRGICLLKKGLVNDAADDFRRVLKLTNHSDFADPAKEYLRKIESPGAPGLPFPAAESNGAPPTDVQPEPRSKDFIV